MINAIKFLYKYRITLRFTVGILFPAVNNEGTSVKSKINKGILFGKDIKPIVQQGDLVEIHGSDFYVTAVEPVLYSDEVIAYEVSVEEFIEGVN